MDGFYGERLMNQGFVWLFVCSVRGAEKPRVVVEQPPSPDSPETSKSSSESGSSSSLQEKVRIFVLISGGEGWGLD